jgi:hypothetical protein
MSFKRDVDQMQDPVRRGSMGRRSVCLERRDQRSYVLVSAQVSGDEMLRSGGPGVEMGSREFVWTENPAVRFEGRMNSGRCRWWTCFGMCALENDPFRNFWARSTSV